MLKNLYSLAGIYYFFKNLTSLKFWKKTRNKTTLFPVDKKLVSNRRNKGLTEKYVPNEEWTASTGSSWLLSEKIKENWFHYAEK